ncbi:MAG TPA: antibiotic biosynthesis monooxygenase family protein [Gaiellaceae bacterium]|nr:antibiotic biosynthesis monooxygenase family protein [Gaiellaceae bacterium]
MSPQPIYSTGSWQPFPGQEEAFVAAWREFARWATGFDGAGEAILARDVRADGRFVSFLGWSSMEAMRAWKDHAEFKERMSRVQEHIDKFAPTELDVVARAQRDA